MSLPDLSHLPPASQDALLNGPALAPPANVEPNFEDPPNGSDFSIAIIYLCIFISSLLVMIRLYVSWFIYRKIYVSDVMLILSFGLGIAYYGVVLDSIYHVGYLVHQWDVRLRDMIYMLRSFIITPTLYGFSIMFIKLAIVLEWLRIFNPRGVKDIFYWTSYAIVAINVIFYPVAAFILNLACRPFEKFWNPFVPGTCYNPYSTYVAAGVVNFVVDVMILLLPQKVIWGLQIPAKKKLGVAAIFAVGLFAIVAAGFRLVWTVQYVTSDDMLYRLTALGLWTMAEMACGIIIFCVPSIPKAFGHLQFPRLAPSLKFWTRSSEGTSQASRAGTSSSGAGYKRGVPRPYQKLEGPDQIPLRNLGSATDSNSHLPPGQRTHLQQNDSAILRTTQFTATSYEDITRGTTSDQFKHQHPWTSVSR